jgi:hypothetical protein
MPQIEWRQYLRLKIPTLPFQTGCHRIVIACRQTLGSFSLEEKGMSQIARSLRGRRESWRRLLPSVYRPWEELVRLSPRRRSQT